MTKAIKNLLSAGEIRIDHEGEDFLGQLRKELNEIQPYPVPPIELAKAWGQKTDYDPTIVIIDDLQSPSLEELEMAMAEGRRVCVHCKIRLDIHHYLSFPVHSWCPNSPTHHHEAVILPKHKNPALTTEAGDGG